MSFLIFEPGCFRVLAVGADADVVVWNPEATRKISVKWHVDGGIGGHLQEIQSRRNSS